MKNYNLQLPIEAEISDFNYDLDKSDVSLRNDLIDIEYELEFEKSSELIDFAPEGTVIGQRTHKSIANLVGKPVRQWIDGDCIDIPDYLLEYALLLFKEKQNEIEDKLNNEIQ